MDAALRSGMSGDDDAGGEASDSSSTAEHTGARLRPQKRDTETRNRRPQACGQDWTNFIRKPLLYPLSYEGDGH
jgi:hypothetical protein